MRYSQISKKHSIIGHKQCLCYPGYEREIIRVNADISYLDLAVVLNEENKKLTIFVVNKDMDNPMLLECDIRSLEGYKVKEHIVFEHENRRAVNTRDNPYNVVPHKGGNTYIQDGKLIVAMPRLSWNVSAPVIKCIYLDVHGTNIAPTNG